MRDKIAQDLGVTKQTLITWQSELNDQIKEQTFYELQTITEAYAVTRKQRFDANAKLLGAVMAEMTRRADADQLAEIPTDKLVNLALVLERRISQDTGRELVSIRVDSTQKLFRSMDGEYIDAD